MFALNHLRKNFPSKIFKILKFNNIECEVCEKLE